MTIGYLFLLGSLIGFSLLGVLHKVADRPTCRPRMVTLLLLWWAAGLTATYTRFFDQHGFRMPVSVLAMGAAAGTAASLALFAFQASLRYGKISTGWLILNLCVTVPIFVSVVVYGEAVSLGKGLGVAMVLVAILLMWWDKRIDLARAGERGVQVAESGSAAVALTSETGTVLPYESPDRDDARNGPASKAKWLSLIMLAFLANGLSASSQKVLVELGGGAYVWQFYLILYLAGALVMTAVSVFHGGTPNRSEVAASSAMAVASVVGNICIVRALDLQVPGTIAYPVANGGSLFLVVLAGFLAFRERVNPVGLAGIVLGLAATLILVLY